MKIAVIVDGWPISMHGPGGVQSEVMGFATSMSVNPGCDISVGLMVYVGLDGDGPEICECMEPLRSYFRNVDEVVCAREISLRVDPVCNEVAVMSKGGGTTASS